MKIFTPIQLAFSRPFLLAHTKSNFASTSRFVHSVTADKPGGDRVRGEKSVWTPEEDAKLLEFAEMHPSKWTLIAEKLGTDKDLRACCSRWHRHHEIKSKPWTKQEDERLIEIVDEFLMHAERFKHKKIDWKELVRRWENASKRLGVDLRAVDPETMLKSYDGDCKGVRLTGPDGYYDPNGVPMVVMAYKKTELVLYYLAHRRAARRNQTEEIQKLLKY
ncbi:hypothetical protein FB645_003094 [Coemansia sp. IMI 203386]|nr:hypothetical protein FB645_003094 [Coemansia sp. IMI 203386]